MKTYLFAEKAQQQQVLIGLVNIGKKMNNLHMRIFNAPFTREYIRRVIFSIPDGKALGADGFNSRFYKHTWDIIKDILDFFKTRKLLKVINVTTLTLVPKVPCPSSVNEYRPIACCSILHKCITKLIMRSLIKSCLI